MLWENHRILRINESGRRGDVARAIDCRSVRVQGAVDLILAVPVYYQTRAEGILMSVLSIEQLAAGLGFDASREHAALSFYAAEDLLGTFGASVEGALIID